MPLNPQQLAFKENYTNPNSETFGNATKSAIAAGYGKQYAEQLLSEGVGNNWVLEIIGDLQRLQKAEKVLDKTLDMDTTDAPEKMRIQTDVAKFVTSRLGKHKYSERQEHTGKNGEPLPVSVTIVNPDKNA